MIWRISLALVVLSFLIPCHGAPGFDVEQITMSETPLSSPNCIAYHPSGLWVVSDTGNDRVLLLDEDLRPVLEYSGDMLRPRGVAVDADGMIWICDSGNDRVLVLDENLELFRILGEGSFDLPWGVSVGQGGVVAVSDSLNRRVQIFSANGSLLRSIGSWGTAPGQFDGPLDVAFNSDGRLVVVDAYLEAEGYLRRVQVFSPEYTLEQVIWDISNRLRFTRPVGVGTAPDGSIAVADFMANRIYLFARDGSHLGGITRIEGHPDIKTPYDVAFAGTPGKDVVMGIVESDPGRVRLMRFSISEPLGLLLTAVSLLLVKTEVRALLRPVNRPALDDSGPGR